MNNKNDIDPFGQDPKESDINSDKLPERKSPKKQKSMGRKIAYSAVGSALSVIMMVLTCYFPVITVLPLIMISLSFNVVMERCGIGYGIMTMLVSVGLGFLACGANVAVLLIVAIVFVPYSLICFAIKKIGYDSIKNVIIRVGIMIAFASLILMIIYFLAGMLISYIDVVRLIGLLGSNFALGYIIINIILVVAIILIDFAFLNAGKIIAKKLK